MFVRMIGDYPTAMSFDDQFPRRVGRYAQNVMRIEVFGAPFFEDCAELI